MSEPAVGLLERSGELEQLAALVEHARTGRGSVALIEGPAGIGKTSLLAAARAMGDAAGLLVLTARAGLLERDLAWNLVRQLFAVAIRSEEPQRVELLADAAALARPALGLPVDASSAPDEAGALHGLYWLASALSERAPLLLAVDDAHWGDLPSLRFLAYIAERVADLPLMLALTVRTGESQDACLHAVGLQAGTERMLLRELSPAATHELTRAALGTDSALEFCDACHAASRGNPFVLRELLAQLAHDRVEPTAARSAEVARVTPESVRRSILLRLSVLPETARELSVALAVLGGDVQLRVLAAVAGLDASAAGSAADALTGAGILAPGAPLRFVHPLMREVIYGQLPVHERSRRHREAAGVLDELGLDVQRVAVQLLQAESLGDEWVVDRLLGAAELALSQGARQPAVDFLTRALDEPPPRRLRISVLRELAAAEALTDSASAIAHLEQALAETDDPGVSARLGLELALMLHRHGDMARAFELGRTVFERLPPGDSLLELRVIATSVTGAILVPALRAHIGPFMSRIPADLIDGTPEACLARSAELAEACARLASMTEVGDLAERALGGGTMLQALPFHELLYWNATSALILAERFDVAVAAIEAGFEHSRRQGSIVGFALASAFRCKLGHRLGRIAEATADGWHALGGLPQSEPHIQAYATAFLIDCLVERGELSTALSLAEAPEFSGPLPEMSAYHLLRVARARARIEAGDPSAAVRELLDVGTQMGEGQFGPAMNPWRARAAVGLSALGERDQAQALAEAELLLSRQTDSAWAEVLSLQALARAAPKDGEAPLEQAIEIAERRGLALEHARSLVQLGALHRRRGRRQAGIELLGDGLELSIACGALAIEERARTELAAAGRRPRRRSITGRNALTAAEGRVAQLAAQGLSNREIAQSLFVSLRTVETHLTHSYQKLGLESRAQLADALSGGHDRPAGMPGGTGPRDAERSEAPIR